MEKSLRVVDRHQHGDAFLRRCGFKHSFRLHNNTDKVIKLTIKSKKPNFVVNKLGLSNFLCVRVDNNFDDIENQTFKVSPNASKKIKADTHNIYITVEIEDKKLWVSRRVSCSYDVHINDKHLKELFF